MCLTFYSPLSVLSLQTRVDTNLPRIRGARLQQRFRICQDLYTIILETFGLLTHNAPHTLVGIEERISRAYGECSANLPRSQS